MGIGIGMRMRIGIGIGVRICVSIVGRIGRTCLLCGISDLLGRGGGATSTLSVVWATAVPIAIALEVHL